MEQNAYTVHAQWPSGESESVEVQASSEREAINIAKFIFDEGYEPGFTVVGAERSNSITIVTIK